MRATVQTVEGTRGDERMSLSTVSELTKARLTTMVLVTTFVGLYAGTTGPLGLELAIHTLLGTGLLAAGAAALNQFIERAADARMERTRERPLPSGKIDPRTALIFGGSASAAGLLYLAVATNGLACLVGAFTLVTYLAVYTPLKRVTPWNTLVGAVPGALPPVIGWTAVQGEMSSGAWSLFAIQFFWQIPHFFAIAWLYREDYARGGFRMLPAVDPSGRRTGIQAILHGVGLLVASLTPWMLGMTGIVYLIGAGLLGLALLVLCARFARKLDQASARLLFLGSILYLPLLLGLLVGNKL